MASSSRLSPILLAMILPLAACSDDLAVERSSTECSDHKDNDGDGLVDCQDPDCRALSICGAADIGAADGIQRTDGGADGLEDVASTDGPFPIDEVEPNDGQSVDQLQEIPLPALVSGGISTANDADIYAMNVIAGERLVVEVTPIDSLQPHVAVFSGAGVDSPPAVNAADSGSVLVEYYALAGGQLLIAIRDRRNVGDDPAGVGGPELGYGLSVAQLDRPPIPIAIGETKVDSLAPRGTVRVFSFDAQADDDLTLQVLTESLTEPSNTDARLSLFHPQTQARLGTNESLQLADALLTGAMPHSGTYHAIVENVALDADDLRFSFSVEENVQ